MIKIAIIGAGVWGHTHAYLYEKNPEIELVAICDTNIAKAQELARKFNLSQIYVL